ncbi:MAG: cyclic-di-GMP-binding protein, partial [Actinomycetota bacterium]|nr:cyclic-di-GMP-binding protein [Actinomycetota bacterium]
LKAVVQVLEEKLVRRKVPLKSISYGKVEEAAKGSVRQTATLNVGITDEKAREIGKFIKGLGLKGVQHQVQGQQLRVSGKKRDDLQAAIAALREHDFAIALQFTNFRD